MWRHPLLYITGAFVSGILLGRLASPAPTIRYAVVSAAAASIIAALACMRGRKDALATIAILGAFGALGALASFVDRADLADSRLRKLFETGAITANEPVEVTGILAGPPEPAPQGYYLDVDADALRIRDEIRAASGQAFLLVPLRDPEAVEEFRALGLEYGARLRVRLKLAPARGYRNPGSPDFDGFLERRGYDLQGTIKSPLLIENLGRGRGNIALVRLFRLRQSLLDAIDRHFPAVVAGTLISSIQRPLRGCAKGQCFTSWSSPECISESLHGYCSAVGRAVSGEGSCAFSYLWPRCGPMPPWWV